MAQLSEIDELIVDGLEKGIPGGVTPFRLGDIGAKRWNVLGEDLPLPVAVLKQSALTHNGRWMASFLGRSGSTIAPHGKTTMSPQLFRRQLDDGAWAITVATVHQVQVCRHFGFNRIVLANQLVGQQAIRFVFDELRRDPEFDFYCLIDSVDGVAMLAEAARESPAWRPLNVLLEGGVGGGRTGCRDLEAALTVARAVKGAAPYLALRGIEGFEGVILADSVAERERKVGAFLDFLAGIATACAEENLFAPAPVILSAGGSAFYDMVVDRFKRVDLGCEMMVLTRSGCYLSHDSALYRRYFARLKERCNEVDAGGEGPRPAIEIWAYVQSRPEPGKVILTMGRRDVSFDADMPVPEQWFRPSLHAAPEPIDPDCVVTHLNDQHAHMTVPPGGPLRVGDMVAFGISHPCTTFDKWRLLFVVDENYTVTSAIRTFF
ncbi:MAG: amino acid deaminase [Kiloniellales bacterium]